MNSLRQFLHAAAPRGFFAIRQLLALLFALPAAAGPLLSPSTPTYGGIVSGGNFVTGSGTSSQFFGNRWPFGQEATKAVDGQIGPGSKYLNLNITDTALLFSGTTARVPARLELWVAEDAVERDPTSYTLYGSSAPVPPLTSGSSYALSNFTQIASGTLALPDPRDTTSDGFGYSQIVPIPGSTAYVSYLLVFPTVKNAPTAANSMQISEVQLYADGINAVESSDFSNTGPGPSFFLEPGVNRISGTLLSPSDLQDRFSVIVPSGTRLLSVSDTNAFNSGVPTTFPLPAGTYPVLFSTNFAPAPGAPWFFNLTVESVPSTLPIIGVESFDYPDGPIAAKNGGTFWDYKNFAPTAHTGTASPWENVTAAPAIASGRLVTQNSSAKRKYNGASEENGAVNDPASFPSSVAKSVYYRVTVTTGATVPTEFGLSSYDFGTEKIFFGKRAASSIFLAEETGVGQTGSATTVLPNTTYTLVAMVDYAANIVRLYLNPDLNAPESTQPPAVTRAYTGTNWSTAVRLASSGGSPVVWDNLVVATAWDVLGTVVTTTVDEDNLSLRAGGNGVSLREAVKYAPAGGLITFAPGLNGQTCTLSTGNEIVVTKSLTLDASSLSSGLVIDAGPGTNRHFRIASGTTVNLHRLRLYGGNGTGGGGTSDGGSIHTSGTLTLRECMIADCTSPSAAGAILSDHPGVLTLERCTLYGNSADSGGGAIAQLSENLLTLTACTIANNTARFEAGGINAPFGRPVLLDHCTVSGNSVTRTGANGVGGVRGDGGGVPGVTVRNSIISGNTDANFPGTPNIGAFRTVQGNNVIDANANLAALGDYGGPAWTMPPRAGSPAIDAATSSAATTDQRGVGRPLNGDDFEFARADIGAVEVPAFLTVTTRFDDNETPAGPSLSLREAIRDAEPGATILFAPNFDGEEFDTIRLSQSLGEIAFTKGLILDASANTGGVTVDGGPGANRIFYLGAGSGTSLHRLTLTGGGGAGATDSGIGGAIYCRGATLALTDCALHGNSANLGGAILNYEGTLTMDRCLLTSNSCLSDGGAVRSKTIILTGPATSATTLTNCTLAQNTAPGIGGGFYNFEGRANLRHCTVTGNSASASAGSGVASYGDNKTRTTAQNCLIAGNTNAGDVSFINGNANSFVSLGGNVIGSGNSFSGGNSLTAYNQPGDTTAHTAATARLAPLADYGGPTHTIALRPGSPARDIATPSRVSTDQRGFPASGPKDSGAYEAGNYLLESYTVFAQELLPNTATDPQRARAFDFDGDGQSNEAEWLAVTNAADPNSRFTASLLQDGSGLKIIFPTVTGRTYRLLQSSTLQAGSWADSGLPAKAGNGSLQNFIVTPAPSPARRFWRVTVSQP